MQSTVNVTNVDQFLGSQWEFQPDDAWDNHVTFKYVAKGKPTLQKNEFNEMFPTYRYDLFKVGGQGWTWVVDVYPKKQFRQLTARDIYNDISNMYELYVDDRETFIHKVSEIYNPQQILLICREFNINHVCYKYKNHPYTTEVKCSCYVRNAGKGKIFLDNISDIYYAFRPDENELGSMLK